MITLIPDEVRARFGPLFSERYLVMVDRAAGVAEILETCRARGPVEWDAMNRRRAGGAIESCTVDGTTLRIRTRLGRFPVRFGPAEAQSGGQALEAVELVGDEVVTSLGRDRRSGRRGCGLPAAGAGRDPGRVPRRGRSDGRRRPREPRPHRLARVREGRDRDRRHGHGGRRGHLGPRPPVRGRLPGRGRSSPRHASGAAQPGGPEQDHELCRLGPRLRRQVGPGTGGSRRSSPGSSASTRSPRRRASRSAPVSPTPTGPMRCDGSRPRS